MYLRLKANFVFNKTVPHSQPLLEQAIFAPFGNIMIGETDSLAFMPLQSRACENFNLQLNQQSISGNMKDWLEPLMRYGYGKEDIDRYLSNGPNKHDAFVNLGNYLTLGGNRNPLSTYGNSEFQNRGGLLYRIVSNTTTRSEVEVEWTEQLMLSPLMCSNKDEQGFIGLNNLTLNLSLSNLHKMWSHDVDNSGFNFDSIDVTFTRPTLSLCYLTPPLMAKASLNNVYPYYQVERYTTDNNISVPGGNSAQYISNNIQLSSVPKRVFIYCRERDADRSWASADGYAAITSIDVHFNNLSGILSSAQTEDLFELSCRNGLETPWSAYRYWLGSVLCLDFGRDINLDELTAVGMQGQYNLQITANIENISESSKNYVMYLVVVSEGAIKIVGTEVSKSVGSVVPNNLFEDMNSIEALAYSPQKDFYGGIYTGAGFWDTIKKIARKTFHGVQKALPYVQKGLPYAERAIKYIAPLLAAGYSGDDVARVIKDREPTLSDNQIRNMLEASGFSGSVPSSGGGVRVQSNQLGGRRVSRKSLRNRM